MLPRVNPKSDPLVRPGMVTRGWFQSWRRRRYLQMYKYTYREAWREPWRCTENVKAEGMHRAGDGGGTCRCRG
jgi:hypothetical protein